MSNVFQRLINVYQDEKLRQNAAIIAMQKVFQRGNTVVFGEREYKEIMYMGISTIGTSAAGLGVGMWGVKRGIYRIAVVSAVGIGIFFYIWPYYLANVVEGLAETPTDYGQTIRAVMIFKYNQGRNTKHYETLSEKYRAYMKIKEEKNR